jgi:hypothetical protein
MTNRKPAHRKLAAPRMAAIVTIEVTSTRRDKARELFEKK